MKWLFILLLTFVVNGWCTKTKTTGSSLNSSREKNDISPYIELVLCPLRLQPQSCARQMAGRILDGWDDQLNMQWNKLKEQADHQLNVTLDRRGYSVNEFFTKEKPSTILRKIEIGYNYMKQYFTETLDGLLMRDFTYTPKTINKMKTVNITWARHFGEKKADIMKHQEYNGNKKEASTDAAITIKPLPYETTTTDISEDNKNINKLINLNSFVTMVTPTNSTNPIMADNVKSNDKKIMQHSKRYGKKEKYSSSDADDWMQPSDLFEEMDDISENAENMIADGKHKDIMKYGRSNGVMRGKKKKKKKAILKLMLLGSFLKAKIELLLKILSAGLQIKFFGIALIGLLINIARFWIDVKRGHSQKVVYVEHAHHQHHYEDHGDDWNDGGGSSYWKRSLQTDATNNGEESQTDSYKPPTVYDSQSMAYRNQWK